MNHCARALALMCLIAGIAIAEQPKTPTPQNTAELQLEIEKILRETKTPGAGVAIVRREGPQWVAGIGLADVAANKPATSDTLFRIGSISKSFVSLSLLKLQQEGRLNLQDRLRVVAPEVEFTNQWEDSAPVRIVHLLEHTSGWDDLALREYAFNPEKEVSLREGLAYYPKSRWSRWKPGTRFSYCNSGPGAAAYVVEKVTGQRFEDYVEDNWFKPLGMDTASYFDTPEVESRLTRLYHGDGKTPYSYWHIIVRPAGAINASPKEMANYVQFFLNRGAFGGVQLLPAEAIERMETPTSTYEAREGLRVGYGLGNYTSMPDGWVFHGHNGGMQGALAELGYMPDAGLGYVFMINSGSGKAYGRMGKLLRAYITRDLAKPALPPAAAVPAALAQEYAGWYEPISPRNEQFRFAERLVGLCRVTIAGMSLRIRPVAGSVRNYVAASERFFRSDDEPQPTLALVSDGSEGTLIQVFGTTFRRIPAWLAWAEIVTVLSVVLLMASALVFALVWVPRKLLGRMRGVPHLSLRTLPLLSALSFVAIGGLLMWSAEDIIESLGQPGPVSVAVCALTIAFAVFAVLGLAQAVRLRQADIRRGVWWHSFAVSLAVTVAAAYLAHWGVIGWRSWA